MRPMSFVDDEDVAVSAVVGTVLVLGITIVAIAGILAFGLPTLTRLQDQAALQSMSGQFVTVREEVLGLSIVGSATVPSIRLGSGSLSIEPGNRMLVVADYDILGVACSLDLTSWTAAPVVPATSGSCGPTVAPCLVAPPPPCIRIFEVSGASLVEQPATILTSGFPASSDWLVRVEKPGGGSAADAWILSSERLAWHHASGQSDMTAILEWGGIFVRSGGEFRVKPPAVQEADNGDLAMRLVGFDGGGAISGNGDYGLFATMSGQHVRANGAASLVHLEFSGDFADTWCSSLLARANLDGAPVDAWRQTTPGTSVGTSPLGASSCTALTGFDQLFAVTYDPLLPLPATFNAVIIHATIDAQLQL